MGCRVVEDDENNKSEMMMKPIEEPAMKDMSTTKKDVNKGTWTAEEDRKLAEVIAIHGAKKWKTIAAKAGLNRCGKSCRLRWMNYLRPNIKRGNISDQEEDLILRLHKLLGNRWSLIAGRLPGRTDNEVKNYWNSHLSKKIELLKERENGGSASREMCVNGEERKAMEIEEIDVEEMKEEEEIINGCNGGQGSSSSAGSFNIDDFFDFSNENPLNLEWMSRFVQF